VVSYETTVTVAYNSNLTSLLGKMLKRFLNEEEMLQLLDEATSDVSDFDFCDEEDCNSGIVSKNILVLDEESDKEDQEN
jgi:hypothetical protein